MEIQPSYAPAVSKVPHHQVLTVSAVAPWPLSGSDDMFMHISLLVQKLLQEHTHKLDISVVIHINNQASFYYALVAAVPSPNHLPLLLAFYAK